ncbi:chemotaxis protein CheY [Microbacterium mangrovi]|uniref:Transcriptional regulatory protein n=1 Tax=Microbacterium mangrovi TaxID=1348253 RepID=A0A0B2AAD6_9MICO|nr:response regulator [Microbacterium mangrovi]KHK98703.1 chemotaxis protein CheY [Microbacterium mangrovi]
MIRVLLVDDEALTLELHRSYVERIEGFEVVAECSSARAALTALVDRDLQIDLVLLDVTMPGGSGLDVLRQLRARASAVDVIAITAIRDAEVVRAMAALGVSQYLVKPFAFPLFRERMTQYRDARRRALESAGAVTQSEIDALLGALHPSAAPLPLPKGLSAATLDAVSEVLRTTGALSAREAASALGMSRVAARRYLEHLAESGRAVRAPRYGTPGRPETEYRWR